MTKVRTLLLSVGWPVEVRGSGEGFFVLPCFYLGGANSVRCDEKGEEGGGGGLKKRDANNE